MTLTISEALSKGVDAHQIGKYHEAEKLYRFVLSSNPKNPDANHNLGSLSIIFNKIDDAISYFKKALKANPKIEQFWMSYVGVLIDENRFSTAKLALSKARKLGLSNKIISEFNKIILLEKQKPSPPVSEIKKVTQYFEIKSFKEAENSALLIIKSFPHHSFAWKILSNIYRETKRYKEAYINHKKNIELSPNDPEAHNDLGLTLLELKQFNEAQISFHKAIELKPDFYEAFNNLGCLFQELKNYSHAEKFFYKAIKLNPNLFEAHMNLGQIHYDHSRIKEALDCYIKGIEINPSNLCFLQFCEVLKERLNFTNNSVELNSCIIKLLEINQINNIVRPADITVSLISLIKSHPYFKSIASKEFSKLSYAELERIITHLSKDQILIKLITICPIPDLEIEEFLREIRAALIFNISKINLTLEIKEFLTALALQCYTNEYIYEETQKELISINTLEKKLKKELLNGNQPKFLELAILASYRALFEFEWGNSISINADNSKLLNRILIEPKKENELASKISNFKIISDKISLKVKGQYEENPYPRWVNTSKSTFTLSIPEFIQKNNFKANSTHFNKIKNPRILVAGCGTGQHSILASTRFKNSTVLAIDLSLRSLGYAKMKTEELRINNIEYKNADILDLGNYKEKFDIIESSGVLHHMEDPLLGWKILTKCLNKGGLMAIGLYSELARKDIVEARKEIKSLDLSANLRGIKSFRNIIRNSNELHHEKIKTRLDFYTTSELRDLLFHVQEHLFTIPLIIKNLNKLGLTFCGFESEKLNKMFKEKYPEDEKLYDLNFWNEFEIQNPDAFVGMYQFWCQKL